MRPGAWPTRHWTAKGFPGLLAFFSLVPLPAGGRKERAPTVSAFWDQIPGKRVPRSRTSLEPANRCCRRPFELFPQAGAQEKASPVSRRISYVSPLCKRQSAPSASQKLYLRVCHKLFRNVQNFCRVAAATCAEPLRLPEKRAGLRTDRGHVCKQGERRIH